MTTQIKVNFDELFLLSAAVKMFSKNNLYEYWGFIKDEVEKLHERLVREEVKMRNCERSL